MIPHRSSPVTDAPPVQPAPDRAAHAVTVVIATRNRRDSVLRTVRRLRELPEQPPVIVVDDGSTDGTAVAVREAFGDVTVLQPEVRGVTAARNAGVRAANTTYVAFSDDDSWWAAGALDAAARRFGQHPQLGLVAGRILVGDQQAEDPTCVAMAASPLPADGLPGPRVLGFVACGAVVRRAAFLDVGGFPEHYVIGAEEQPLALALAAAGWDLVYLADVVAHHHPGDVERDHRFRDRNVTRNDLWTAWRYRRGLGALVETAAIARTATTAPRLTGVALALLGLPAVLRERSPVPPDVEAQRRLLDAADPGHDEHDGTTAAGPRTPPPWLPAVARRRSQRVTVGVVAHHRPSAPREVVEQRLAVVVITHNRAQELVANLHRLADVPERPHVVVVDNASTDGTSEAVRAEHPWVELVVLDANAGAVGRNVAVDLLTQPFVAFADDDTWWAAGSLRQAADVLEQHPRIAVVTARIVVEPAGVEDPVVADMRHSPLSEDPELPGHPLLSFLAGASVVRRAAFHEVGGFEPMLRIGGEEELLAADLLAAGWKLRYIPYLTVHHAASSARDPHRRRADGLRNTLWFTWLRRPLPRAAWRSFQLLRRVPRDRVTTLALVETLRGLPSVLRERNVLPAAVEREYRLLDRAQLDSRARRYVS